MFVLLAACQVGAAEPPALVFEADKAAMKTEGGPNAGPGCWNLWSNGQVGQAIRCVTTGRFQVVVRAWGSVAGGVWPEMALRVDGLTIQTVSVTGTNHADYQFETELKAGVHEIAVAFLNDALIGKEDRNLYLERFTILPPKGTASPTLADAQELLAEAGQREAAIVAATQPAIERNRKSDALVRLVDAAGKPVAGAKITVTQTGHEFLFGGNIYGFDRSGKAVDAAYKDRFAEIFNYATVGFYWSSYEAQRGKPNYEYTDRVVAWGVEHGIRMKGHPLLWGDAAGVPPWSNGQPAPAIQRHRVEEIMTRYGDRIGFWEVVNEPSHLPEPKIDDPYRWARQINPRAYLIVNDYHVLADGGPGFFHLLSTAKRNGVPFDGVGIQAHEPRTTRFPLDQVQRIFDHYATLGKELHITEFTPTSAGAKITGSHRSGIWDEPAQADYAVKFYRVCFAHPALRGITWWDLSDKHSWLPGGGLLRADMSPKPAYEELKKLIHQEWMTRTAGTSDAAGQFAFRGFRGPYQVSVEAHGAILQKQFLLGKGERQELLISLGQ